MLYRYYKPTIATIIMVHATTPELKARIRDVSYVFVTSSKAISVFFHSITVVCIPYLIILNEKSNYNNKERTRTSVKEVPSSRNLAERKRRNANL